MLILVFLVGCARKFQLVDDGRRATAERNLIGEGAEDGLESVENKPTNCDQTTTEKKEMTTKATPADSQKEATFFTTRRENSRQNLFSIPSFKEKS
jgi:hypothetical protein